MKILVVGGTRFFGKKLVEQYIENGHEVTILTRGLSTNPFHNHVQQLIVDYNVTETWYDLFEGFTWMNQAANVQS